MRLAEFKIEKPKPEDTMGITRDKMPQVKSTDYDEYKSYLKKNGVTLTSQVVSAKDLKPIQKEFSDQGVERQLTKNKKYDGQNPKPLLASSDSWIIDGHHRWLAALNTGRDINILRANVDVHELLSLTLKFPSVYFKDIYTEDESMDIIAKAEQFAQEAHKDHKRKYTGEPYYVHLDEVRNIVKQAGGSVNQQCAALLHDTVEDTSVTPADVTREFGPQIAKLVVELTDVSKPEDGNRKVRKGIDRDKLAGVSAEAQTVKYADLISNGRDIGKNDPKFAKVYHAEKADLLRVMKNGKASLRKEAINMLPDELKAIANSQVEEEVKLANSVISSQQMLTKLSKEMQGTHTGAMDPNSDWSKFVLSHKGFTLKDIQVDKIPTAVKSDGMSQANVEKYKKADTSQFPPMVIGNDGYLLDGNHRLQAYKAQGIKTVKAYVGEEVEVSLHGDAKKGYVLSKIEVSGDERNAGQGTKEMQNIVDRMDREGAIIALTPDDAFGGNKNRLIKFYKRFGFVPNKGRNKDFRFRETMIRYPQTNERVNEALNTMLSALREEALNVKPIITQAIRKLDKVFKKNQYEVRIVGGAVRDIALGKEPKDIDFATDATPDEMIAMLDKEGIRHIPTGIEHGTITAVIDGEDFEITTLRADTNTDGRHADVEFVRSWEEDAKRRDLTYNAMSMDIDGTVHDYNGGMDDLQDKVSRFVGDPEERIKEDYLRILRYFRFQSKLDSPKWDDVTLNAIKDNADGMTGLSVERIWQEMSKLLMGSSAKEALEWMNKTGVSSKIGLEGINPAKLGEPTGPIIALARMLDSSGIARDWKMSNYDREMFDFLIKHKGENINPKQAQDMIINGASQDHLLAWANMHGKNDVYDAVHGFEQPDFPINGKDLLARGYVAGPNLGKMIADLKDEWMKSNYKLSKEDLLNKVPVKETIVLEAVGKFMTGHNVKFAGKKYEQIEVEVTGVDNDKRLYHISILHPKELFGKQVSISAKFMHRGPWVKTDTKKVANWAESKYDNWMNKKSLDEDFERLLEDNTPDVYVDMDGVLVDFFNEWARIMNVKSYRDIPKEQIGKALKKIVNTPNFWEDLPTLAGHKELLNTIKATKGKYKILSSPLANDPNVDPGKREWVRKHLNFFKPEQVIIDHNKSKYATKQDGTPNLLIDDFGKNVKGWQSAGGIAIKHHTTTTANTVQAIKKVFSRKDVKEAAGVGRVVPGINTTVDVGPNEITKQAKKFGNDVDKDGKPKKLLRTKKK
jgi:tRNA nucleotidyltransferase (CCA-adding enzyme)